jgi:hypothetical protein
VLDRIREGMILDLNLGFVSHQADDQAVKTSLNCGSERSFSNACCNPKRLSGLDPIFDLIELARAAKREKGLTILQRQRRGWFSFGQGRRISN